ncbi:hypothetical protein CQ020_23810 [Arthrobacter sp. MYb23]|uniref:hypothetical protein n=1 Tax=unclassified Arthrobacter TaxID=235627 RepID=UPI000CFBC27A|nr:MULTISPECIES: hypothetical protein [unclassified Arthrobacter]PRB33082.1 hypothetical protein CQ038_23765 [Arthrobacter sp. MYb51]PRB87952.1 hypothetical protein CQ020_23810 [Arthrobacter sp. MYb23]
MPEEVLSVTGWSRENARRRLVAVVKALPGPGRALATPIRKAQGGRACQIFCVWECSVPLEVPATVKAYSAIG